MTSPKVSVMEQCRNTEPETSAPVRLAPVKTQEASTMSSRGPSGGTIDFFIPAVDLLVYHDTSSDQKYK